MAESPVVAADSIPACLLTIFGATGDLCKRLLLPSLYNLAALRLLPDGFRLLGVAMEGWDDARFREHIAGSLKEFWGSDADSNVVVWLQQRARYVQGNFDDPASFAAVRSVVQGIEKAGGTNANRLFYLAVAPSFIAPVTALLVQADLISGESQGWQRLLVEKPFGHDLSSAIALNAELGKSLREDQIYRIDHFAGKDAVQDLTVLRFSNAIFEPLWNRSMIDHVQITAAETVGVEGRAGYYEKSGALRDMVPNHLAELLSLIAMEPPVSFSAEHMRDKQVEALASLRQLRPEEVGRCAVRGQYGEGGPASAPMPGYRKEPGVSPSSNTETYVAMRLEIDNWRWAGVPFYLRTGKRLSRALTEVVVTFREPPARLFPRTAPSDRCPNQLVLTLQPAPKIALTFGTKAPGLKTTVEQGSMDFTFNAGSFGEHAKGYERLFHDAMRGDPTLFQGARFIEAGWRMVQPLLDAWQQPPSDPFPNYRAGSTGPEAADRLFAETGHKWHSLEGDSCALPS